ncbi:hypothetical protein [Saccharospirillum sp.]|uniref:hypothetical protein n=1 Tax=Saccharospirillum sp. TaxID=2033801 RepID=UPI0034A01EE0
MLQPFRQPASTHLDRVESWTRSRFELNGEAVVVVAEVRCQVPGCPPIETIVAFWLTSGPRYRFKVFKPLAEVIESDIPVKWLLPALEDAGDLGCDCC